MARSCWSARSASAAVHDSHACSRGKRRIFPAMAAAFAPEIRTTPKPPRPGGVETATMVSFRFNAGVSSQSGGKGYPPGLGAPAALRSRTATVSATHGRAAGALVRRRRRLFRQTGHSSRINNNLAESAVPAALAAHFGLVAQSQMNHAALAAIHGIEPEGSARALHFFGRRSRAQPQFFDAQSAIILRVERQARVILGRHM